MSGINAKLFTGYCDEWKLMAAGTAHGLVVFDCLQNITITTKCSLNAQGKSEKNLYT